MCSNPIKITIKMTCKCYTGVSCVTLTSKGLNHHQRCPILCNSDIYSEQCFSVVSTAHCSIAHHEIDDGKNRTHHWQTHITYELHQYFNLLLLVLVLLFMLTCAYRKSIKNQSISIFKMRLIHRRDFQCRRYAHCTICIKLQRIGILSKMCGTKICTKCGQNSTNCTCCSMSKN